MDRQTMTGASARPAEGSQEHGHHPQDYPAAASSSSHSSSRKTSSTLTHPSSTLTHPSPTLTDPLARDRVSGGSKKMAGGSVVKGEERMGMLGVRVGERRGVLYNAIPCMPLPLAVLCCLLNIVIPGMGTFISAWAALCGCRTRLGSRVKALGWGVLAALGQMLTFVLILGWVWSILWGMNFVHIAMSRGESQKIPYYVRRQSSVE